MKNKSYALVSVLLLIVLGAAFYSQRDSGALSSKQKSAQSSGTNSQEVSAEISSEDGQMGSNKSVRRGAYSFPQRAYVTSDNALAVIRELTPRAQAGDAEAALSIYLKLDACRDPMSNDMGPEQFEMRRKAGQSEESLLQAIKEKAEGCQGVDYLMQKDRGKWLELAAKAGQPEAQLMYATDVESVIGTGSDMLRDPERIQKYKADSSRYLHDLASGGNVSAMLELANNYDVGIMAKEDPMQAYAYYRAAQMAMPSKIPESLIQLQKEKVPAGSRAQAERLAQQIYASCCGK